MPVLLVVTIGVRFFEAESEHPIADLLDLPSQRVSIAVLSQGAGLFDPVLVPLDTGSELGGPGWPRVVTLGKRKVLRTLLVSFSKFFRCFYQNDLTTKFMHMSLTSNSILFFLSLFLFFLLSLLLILFQLFVLDLLQHLCQQAVKFNLSTPGAVHERVLPSVLQVSVNVVVHSHTRIEITKGFGFS